MRLSYSASSVYELCPQKWKLQKIDKLRAAKISSPLFFGSALDEAFSHVLLQKKEVLTDAELDLQLNFTADELFYSKMLVISHNNQSVELSQSLLADYYASDFAAELLKPEHLGLLQSFEPAYKLTDYIDFHLQCKEQLSAKKKLLPDDQRLFNYLSWLTMVEKGKLMIQSYKDVVMPQIERVYDIQKPISILNGDGDEISGLIDFTASFTSAPGVKYIVDNKTSSKPYPANSVKESTQLATYCEAEGVKTAAYVVVEKKIFKKGDPIRSTVILDEIPEQTFEQTFEKYDTTLKGINAGAFPQNRKACFSFGRLCEYYAVCEYNDRSSLVDLSEK